MTRIIHICILIFCFTLVLSNISYSMIKIDKGGFDKYGIKFNAFRICVLSQSGDMLVAIEKVGEAKLIKEGKSYKIYIFELDVNNNKINSCKSVYSDLEVLEQVVLSEDTKKLLVFGNSGTKVLCLDTSSMKLSTIFKHQNGKPGFRCEFLGMYNKGNFYVKGYFYDKERYSLGDYIAKVDIKKSGVEAFEKTCNLNDVIDKLNGPLHILYLISPDLGYLAVKKKKEGKIIGDTVVVYNNGNFTTIDEALGVTDLVGSNKKVIYNIVREMKKPNETIVYDIKTQKKWNVGSYMSYSSISHNEGNVIIVAQRDNPKLPEMSFFIGKEENNYEVKPINELQHVLPGLITLSAKGNVYAYLSKDLIINKI